MLEVSPQRYQGPLARSIGEWASSLLESYSCALAANTYRGAKQVHDPIGKVIELEPWEVPIMDSPLMQRLRYIRQLGVGHYLFPTAGYSRFEHSLGAVHTASRMFDAVTDSRLYTDCRPENRPAIDGDEAWKQRCILRLAALMHDAGHCVFSHVSERFYASHPDVEAAVAHYRKHFRTGSVTASEAVTLAILESDAVATLLTAAGVSQIGSDVPSILSTMAACVAGSVEKVAPNCFLADIINGAVDCDKLDYLARDAHMAGLPIPLDIDRLLSKLRLAIKKGDPALVTLCTVPSGIRSLDELQVSRIFMYDKFYYHPKVMAAEELLRAALTHLASAIPEFSSPATLLQFGDDELLALSEPAVATRFRVTGPRSELRKGIELLARARNRVLPKRAFAFALRYVPDASPVLSLVESAGKSDSVNQDQAYTLREVNRWFEDPRGRRKYGSIITTFTGELGSKARVFFGLQKPQRAAGSMHLPVVLSDGSVDEKPAYMFKNSEWTEAYALNKSTSYVFADADCAKVHLAAERFFLEREGLTFAPSCWVMAKVNQKDIDLERSKLPPKWIGQRLPPNYLRSSAGTRRIDALRDKFSSFLRSVHKIRGPQLVETWLGQAGDSDIRESALRFLEHVTYVEAGELRTRVKALLTAQPSLKDAIWIPLRPVQGRGKSADQVIFDLKDLAVTWRSTAALTAEDIKNAGQVVYFDDALNTGVQASSLVSSWFERTTGRFLNKKDMDAAGPLSTEVRNELKTATSINFVFCAMHPHGKQMLEATTQSLGISRAKFFSSIQADRREYTIKGVKYESGASEQRFVNWLRKTGELLLMERVRRQSDGWTKTRAHKFALGYGGLGLTVVFRHSISTSTPVALWDFCPGPTDVWIPLFPRNPESLLGAMGNPPSIDEDES